MRPVTQPLGTGYGVKGTHWAAGRHTGVDYLTPNGTSCKAAVGGKVLHAGKNSATGWGAAYGVHVITQANIGGTVYRLLYAHLGSVAVKVGATVTIGQVIGKTDSTGNVTGPHLHFEVRRSPYTYGNDVNPQIAVNVTEATVPKDNRVSSAHKDLAAALRKLDAALTLGKRGPAVKAARDSLRQTIKRLPPR